MTLPVPTIHRIVTTRKGGDVGLVDVEYWDNRFPALFEHGETLSGKLMPFEKWSCGFDGTPSDQAWNGVDKAIVQRFWRAGAKWVWMPIKRAQAAIEKALGEQFPAFELLQRAADGPRTPIAKLTFDPDGTPRAAVEWGPPKDWQLVSDRAREAWSHALREKLAKAAPVPTAPTVVVQGDDE